MNILSSRPTSARRFLSGGAILACLVLTPAAQGPTCATMTRAEQHSPAQLAAQEFQQSARKGSQVSAAVQRVLREVTWHRKLDEAADVARRHGKPIVWVQALGEIRGLT